MLFCFKNPYITIQANWHINLAFLKTLIFLNQKKVIKLRVKTNSDSKKNYRAVEQFEKETIFLRKGIFFDTGKINLAKFYLKIISQKLPCLASKVINYSIQMRQKKEVLTRIVATSHSAQFL